MTVLCFFITNQIRGNTLRFSRIYISTGSGVTPESILHLWPNILIPYFLKLLIYSVSVWWKCGHYPSIRSHIVVPLGSIHPSKVYSWGQASVPCIINRTELSTALRIQLHLAGRYRSVLWKTATLWAQSQSYWEMTGCVFVNFSLNHREMTLDLTIWLSPPATHTPHSWINKLWDSLKSRLLCSQIYWLTSSCFSSLDWEYRLFVMMTRRALRKIKSSRLLL